MSIAEQIEVIQLSLEERGLPPESYWIADFEDGSQRNEKDTSWSQISDKETVEYFGGKKLVNLCRFPIRCISVTHAGMNAFIDVPDGARAYQSIRAETTLMPAGKRVNHILGRSIGIVKDGEVIEEKFINELSNEVTGLRK